MSATAAFKEWHVIVEALAAGEQTIILRKGGIAEGRGGFQVSAHRFWLFPTFFHAQRTKTKPSAARFFSDAGAAETNIPPATVSLHAFAELQESWFVTDRQRLAALSPFHFWTEETVDERYAWSKPPGLHVLLVRVYQLSTPVDLAITEAMAGCKSWIELPTAPTTPSSAPVLSDAAFGAAAELIRRTVES